MSLGKGVPKKCSCDFNKVASKFIEITLRYGCSPVKFDAYIQDKFS